MAQQNLDELSTEALHKRQRFASLILGIMAGLFLVNVVLAILKDNSSLIAVAAALVAVSIPMVIGLKKVRDELERRGGS